MIQKTTWCRYKQIDTFLELMSLRTSLGSANNNTMSFTMVLEAVTRPFVVVHSQLPGWRDNKDTCALFRREARLSEQLNSWHHVRQSFAAASLSGTKNVTAVQNMRDSARLDLRGL